MKKAIEEWAIRIFMRFVRIYAPSGKERVLSNEIKKIVQAIGIPHEDLGYDNAGQHFIHHDKTAGDCGNLFINIPATPGYEHLPCIGFNAHMDTVEPANGIKPSLSTDRTRIISDGTTILGADDRAGIAIILTMLKTLHDEQIPHGPLQIILTVSEEYRLLGSRYIAPAMIEADMIFSFDGEDPTELLLGACSSDKLKVIIKGLNAHAGVHPEQGISAPLIFARATNLLGEVGYWGRIELDGQHIASLNLNIIGHQDVGTNSVQAELEIAGEVRSFNRNLLRQLTAAVKRTFANAARNTRSDDGQRGSIVFEADRAYDSFRLTPRSKIVRRATAALQQNGVIPKLTKRVMGGLDACWLNKHHPTICLGTGAHNYHKLDEYLDVAEYLIACDIAVTLARAA